MKFINALLTNLSTMFSYITVIATSILGSVLSLYLLVDEMSLLYRFSIQGEMIFKAILVNIVAIVVGATILQSANKRNRK